MPKQKAKKASKGVPQTSKMNIMKGVGRYRRKTLPNTIRGRGGYAEDIGSSIGSWLGKKAGGLFKSITGLGTYTVTKNSLMANPNDPPVLSNTRGGTRIQHREYITDITGSTSFALTPYSINPGVAATFPWLSGCALNFEEYILHGMVFEFKSTSATALNSTNTALGTVIMATEYNVVNPNFTAKRDMENYVYSTSCSPDVSALHPVECARDINVLSELFVRNTVPPSSADLRFSDIGKFQIATVGMQASATIGELWVTYDIELIKPKLPSAYTSIGPAHYVYDGTSGIPPFGTAPTASNLFGTSGSKLVLFGTGNTPVSLDVNTLTFTAPGRYLVWWWMSGAATACLSTIPTLSATCSEALIFENGGSPTGFRVAPADGVSTELMWNCTAIDVATTLTSVPATATWSGLTIPATVTQFQLFVTPLPVGFTTRELTDLERIQKMVNSLAIQVKSINKISVCCSSDDDCDEKMSQSDDFDQISLPNPPRLTHSQIYEKVASIVSQAVGVSNATPQAVSNKSAASLN